MSDNIPLEIQEEIMKRLPVKSLLQLRSVSKTWKSLIDSSNFIMNYTHMQHLLVTYHDPEQTHVSIADDESFPQHKVSPTIPLLVSMLKDYTIIGSTHGLFCLYTDYPRGMAVLWNPSVRKAVAVVMPNVGDEIFIDITLGFGVCPGTKDLKIVKIRYIIGGSDMERISCIPWQVEVFSLSTGVWRNPYSSNLPCKSSRFETFPVVIDGFIYWLASDCRPTYRNLIISFDLTSEIFREVNLPDSLASNSKVDLFISKLRNSLVVVECYMYDHEGISLWMMQDGVQKSFIKLYTINSPDSLVTGFRKSGEPLLENLEHHSGGRYSTSLVVYEQPYSKPIINLEMERSFYVYPYTETLLLLDQADSIIYDKGKATLLSVEVGNQDF